MTLGILTENGIVMNQIPIMFEEKDNALFGLIKKSNKNEKVTRLIDLT